VVPTVALLDAGDGRRLERFGAVVTDRPAPAATGERRDPSAWSAAAIRYTEPGGWEARSPHPDPWLVAVDGLTLELRPTPAGQVGLFPEHLAFGDWLVGQVGDRPASVLHLFAYTGVLTLRLAAAGASVVHADASRPTVAWARENAARSGLAQHPIRWLVDDASAFVAREGRRGHRYDGIVLDPPSYGHGPGGRAWRLEADLDALLVGCGAILRPAGFVLLTAHGRTTDAAWLGERLASAAPERAALVEAGPTILRAESGATLPLGAWARIMRS